MSPQWRTATPLVSTNLYRQKAKVDTAIIFLNCMFQRCMFVKFQVFCVPSPFHAEIPFLYDIVWYDHLCPSLPTEPESVPHNDVEIPEPEPELRKPILGERRESIPNSELHHPSTLPGSVPSPGQCSSKRPGSVSKPELHRPNSKPEHNGPGPSTRTEVVPVCEDERRIATPVIEAWQSQTDITQQTGNTTQKESSAKRKGSKCVLCWTSFYIVTL